TAPLSIPRISVRFPMRYYFRLLSTSIVALVISSAAEARDIFPPAVQEVLGAACTPDCSICHTGAPGSEGIATANQPLAQRLKALGINATSSQDDVKAAIQKLLVKDTVDTDKGGVTDLQEIKKCTEPYHTPSDDHDTQGTQGTQGEAVQPGFGCGA